MSLGWRDIAFIVLPKRFDRELLNVPHNPVVVNLAPNNRDLAIFILVGTYREGSDYDDSDGSPKYGVLR
jgi:hypothetical protein